MFNLYDSPKYRDFITKRDQVLEDLHFKTQRRISDTLAEALNEVLVVAPHFLMQIEKNPFNANGAHAVKELEKRIDMIFAQCSAKLAHHYVRFSRFVYLLAHAAQSEAVARALGKRFKTTIEGSGEPETDHQDRHIAHSVQLYLGRIKRKIIDAVELARVNEETTDEAIERIRRSFPRVKLYKLTPKILPRPKPIKEAKETITIDSLTIQNYDEGLWNQMLDEYLKDYLPPTRTAADVIKVQTPEGQVDMFEWELERDTMQQFVDQVRSGDEDAGELVKEAKDLGVYDFVWIAILDDRTCEECCEKRDGLLVSEIESKLNSEWKDDECQESTPPGHMACRCALAPVSDKMPEAVEFNAAGWEDWLMQGSRMTRDD